MIVGVAIRDDETGEVLSLPRPNRHTDVLRVSGLITLSSGATKWRLYRGTQGFVDDAGRFLDRATAAVHALCVGQIEQLKYNDRDLFSEDLW